MELTRFAAAEEALEAASGEAPTDALLDFYNELAPRVRGQGEGSDAVGEVNARLREVFEAFYMEAGEDGEVLVSPVLRESVAAEWSLRYVALVGGDVVDVEKWAEPCKWPKPPRQPLELLATGEERIVPPVQAVTARPEQNPRNTLV